MPATTNPRYDGRLGDRKALIRSTFGLCPNCGTGRLFRGLYRVRETCESCGVRFERDSGSWLGAMVVAYGLAVLAVVVVAAVTIVRWGLYQGLEWVLVGTGVLAVLLLYRPVKGFWIWSMWAAGLVLRDDELADRPVAVAPRAGHATVDGEPTPADELPVPG